MGYFNKIGFISSLPIVSGDDTVLIFMLPNKYSEDKNSGVCYSTDWFEPAFLPIYGEYDGYGRIENVKRTKSVEFIENFFDVDINTIIHEVDDNSVGRGSKNCSAKRNNEIYEKLTFGLELSKVYKKMASVKRLAYSEDCNTEFWLDKLGFKQIENNTVSDRYKYTWIHPNVPGYEYHSDKSYGHLFDISSCKEHQGYIFHPKELDEELSKLSTTYKSNITDNDKTLCSIDLSIIHTKLAIEEFEKSLTGDPTNDFRLSLYGVTRYKGYENLTAYLKRCHIDGTCDFDARKQPKELLKTVSENEIADFIRFFSTVSHLNAKFQPSNYGNQDQDLRLHLEMLRCYRHCIVDSMSRWDNHDGEFDNDIAGIKADDRDDKITEVLI